MATCREEEAKRFRNSLKAHMKDPHEGNNQRCLLSRLRLGLGFRMSVNKAETPSPDSFAYVCVREKRDMLGEGCW